QYQFERRHPAAKPESRILSIGNPTLMPSDAELFPRLPVSEREARAVADLYPSKIVLLGPAATPTAFLQNVGRPRIVHFAGHAIVNEREPELSRLLMAADGTGPIAGLFAKDLPRAHIAATMLVALSACETARGRLTSGAGIIGLARAFLNAGASAVVATL